MITKYILLREVNGEVVYDILTLKELCERIIGLNKGIIYTREGELVVAFSEHNIKINRDMQSFPEKLIKSLF